MTILSQAKESMIKNKLKQDDMTADPSKYPQGKFHKKGCRQCSTPFQPKAPSHLYCSDYCKDRSRSNSYYMRNYGVGIDFVEDLLVRQSNLCAICKEEGFKMHDGVFMNLNLDHCHTTGNVRGLLCHNCNRALGLLKDDINRLKSAISYLEGATTIPPGSTPKRVEAHGTRNSDDIVCSAQKCVAVHKDGHGVANHDEH